jgi:chemotaxis protein methyltransferase CheR
VTDALSTEVVFAQFNLMGDINRFRKKFHIIFCRNVMIYFDAPTKRTLVKKFYDALEPGGWLFVGLSETLTGINNDFQQMAPSIYQRMK